MSLIAYFEHCLESHCIKCMFVFNSVRARSYWANLKLWFKQKISKEEFDVEARRLLAQENGSCRENNNNNVLM